MTITDGPRPFLLSAPPADLDDLIDRLARTRWPAGPADPGWDRGIPADRLRVLVDRWRNGFDWRAVETELNARKPTAVTVDGVEMVVLHAVSAEAGALPLVLSHGYPSSAVEFLDVLGPLTDPVAFGGDAADAFTVVVPFLPGFGLAPQPSDHGWTSARMAGALVQVVHALGYERYGVQGGDVGAGVSQDIAIADPAGVVGIHVVSDALATAAVLSFAGVTLDPTDFPDDQRPLIQRMNHHVQEGLGYLAMAGTRPATVGVGLDDSPAALLAWIAEKFEQWTDLEFDGPSRTVPVDRLLAIVTSYWLGRTGSTSAHFLYDARHADREWGAQPVAPRGWAVFGGGGAVVRSLMDRDHQVEHWSEYTQGGHFAALEAPELFVDDVRAFFRPLR